ncbi:alpha/beta hydrolase fold domain-containing protein [Candidatus Izemoplasma sp. B36]|uniref:alpha/beta hydrolase fold domain-containing protein n=1 Tax=Candidatus Izemoplasma sp. B36 TaxID=3242468 RepID=UPI0035560D2E
MLVYKAHKQKSSDRFAVKLMTQAQKLDSVKNRDDVNFKFVYSSILSENYAYPKNILYEKVEVAGITVEGISRKKEEIKYAIIQLHGGAYVFNYNDAYRKNALEYLKCINNVKIFSPIYSLAPEKPYPHALNESIEVYKHVLKEGFKPNNIMIAGDSAGGGLAIALTLYLRDHNIPLPKALITMSAWTNLAMNGKSHTKNRLVDPMFGEGTKPLDVKAYVGENDVKNPYISPRYGDFTRFTDMLMFVGGNEIILSDTTDVANLAKANNEIFVHNFLGMFHVFPFGYKKMASSRKAWKIIKEYINNKFKGINMITDTTKHQDWFKLDNSGKIFPEVSNQRETNTFRVQVALTEDIDPQLLQLASLGILERYPMFKVRMKHGIFWNYLDYNTKPFEIHKMTHRVCSSMNPRDNNCYLFKILYRNNIIAIEMFHSLADGGGVVKLLQSLTFEYLKLKGKNITPDNIIKTKNERPTQEEYEDANNKYYNSKNRKHVPEKKAYRIKGTQLPDNNTGLISGTISTKKMIELSRSKGLTMTQYFSALMMYVIYNTQIKYREHLKSNQSPVKIFVPVNLRKHFPSETLRNFSNFVKTNLVMTSSDITLEELFDLVKKQFAEGMTKSELIRKMSENVAFEKNVFLRFLPYFVKKYALKIGYNMLGMKLNTMSLTNIGRIDFPESMQPYIIDVSAAVFAGYYNAVNCSILSYKDKLKITFTRSIIETTIEREFFRHFTDLGFDVEIESNYVEEFI